MTARQGQIEELWQKGVKNDDWDPLFSIEKSSKNYFWGLAGRVALADLAGFLCQVICGEPLSKNSNEVMFIFYCYRSRFLNKYFYFNMCKISP